MTCISLSALTGAVLATGVVVMLVSEKVGAMQLAEWQIAAIYVAAIAASILIGVKNCAKDNPPANINSGNPESKPS